MGFKHGCSVGSSGLVELFLESDLFVDGEVGFWGGEGSAVSEIIDFSGEAVVFLSVYDFFDALSLQFGVMFLK